MVQINFPWQFLVVIICGIRIFFCFHSTMWETIIIMETIKIMPKKTKTKMYRSD